MISLLLLIHLTFFFLDQLKGKLNLNLEMDKITLDDLRTKVDTAISQVLILFLYNIVVLDINVFLGFVAIVLLLYLVLTNLVLYLAS